MTPSDRHIHPVVVKQPNTTGAVIAKPNYQVRFRHPQQHPQQQPYVSPRAITSSNNKVYVAPKRPLVPVITRGGAIPGVSRHLPYTYARHSEAKLNVIIIGEGTRGADNPLAAVTLASRLGPNMPVSLLHLTREVTNIGEATEDLVSSIMWLTGQSKLPIVIVGWAQAAAGAAIAAQLFQYDPRRVPGIVLLSTSPDDRVAQVLPALTCEKLIIHGAQDTTTPQQVATQVRDLCQKGLTYLHILSDADHTLKSRQHKPEELLQQFLVYLITKQLPA